MSSKKKATEKKAPSTPTGTSSKKKEVASPTPRSTAKAAMPFYDSVGEISIPKIDDQTRDFMLATGVVNDVFTNEEKEKAYEMELDSAFDNPPFTTSDMSRMAEIDYLKGRSERSEDLQDLEKMEEGVRMANRGEEIMRMSPQQREFEVADELLNLKDAVPGLDKDIGDRSTPIPEIDENMFEGTPVRKSRRKKGGMSRAGTHEKLRKEQKLKFIELLQHTERWSDVNSRYNAYLRQDGSPDLLSDEDKLKMFNVTEKAILDDMSARRGGGPTERTLVVTQKEMKKNQAQKFYELLSTHIGYEDANKAFQEYLKETNQPEMFGKKLRMEMFNNIERGIADEFDFESHIVKDQRGGKRTRRRKQTKRKRHLKKGTRKKRKQLKKKATRKKK